VRDYRPGDSMRRIDWKATARLGAMQARVYDPSSSRHLLLCLNTQTTEPMWAGVVVELLERSITVAASIARDAYEARYSVGLLANSTFPDADRSIRIPPGRRAEQFIRMLEALAVVTPYVLEPLAAMLDREEHRLVAGTTVVVVTALMTGEQRDRHRGLGAPAGDQEEDGAGQVADGDALQHARDPDGGPVGARRTVEHEAQHEDHARPAKDADQRRCGRPLLEGERDGHAHDEEEERKHKVGRGPAVPRGVAERRVDGRPGARVVDEDHRRDGEAAEGVERDEASAPHVDQPRARGR